MEWIAYRHHAIARMDGLVANGRDLLERARRLQQRQVVGFIARNKTQFDRGFAAQIALDVAYATVDDMLVGYDMSVIADDKPVPDLVMVLAVLGGPEAGCPGAVATAGFGSETANSPALATPFFLML
jgi:hypothetical protein